MKIKITLKMVAMLSAFSLSCGSAMANKTIYDDPVECMTESRLIDSWIGSKLALKNNDIWSDSEHTKLDLKLQEKKEQVTYQSPSLFEVRSDLVIKMREESEKAQELNKKVEKLQEDLRSYQLEERIDQELKKVNGSAGLLDILGDKEALINNLDAEGAQSYAALSALAYYEYQAGHIKRSERATQTDLEITKNSKLLTKLREYEGKLDKIIKGPTKKIIKSLETFKRGLQDVFGIKVEGATFQDINSAITTKMHEVENLIEKLKDQAALEQSEEISKLQKLLSQNRFAKDLEVKGVFYRNNGEFSGFAAYDKKAHELKLVFAGSKSKFDWLKNFMGWNAKASSRRGLLTDMNLHAGFLSHLEDLSDEAFEVAYKVIQTLNKQSDQQLKITGTGHSLGGAIAALFTAASKQMADSMGIKVKAGGVTFGAPNLAHGGSVARINELFGGAGNWVRFEHSKDPVPVACFWKDNPGIAIRFNGSIFWDTANAMQVFGQNPHGMENYYHSVKVHTDEWKKSIGDLQRLIREKEEKVAVINDTKVKARQALRDVQNYMVQITKFDEQNSSSLRKQREFYLESLTYQVDQINQRLKLAQKKNLALVKMIEDGRDLTQSFIFPIEQELVEASKEHKKKLFLREDLEKNNMWKKQAQKEAEEYRKRVQLLLGN